MFEGIPEENQPEAHDAFAYDRRNLRIETADGLFFFIAFYPSYDWIDGGGTMSYFQNWRANAQLDWEKLRLRWKLNKPL